MNFGLETAHLKIIAELVIAPLEASGAQVWVFGSRARGDHQKFSDLDLLLEGKVSDKLLSKVKEELEDSTLPIKVDLVKFNELAESYKTSVLQDKIRWSQE